MRPHLAIALVLLATGTAAADTQNEVTMGSYVRALHSSSANAVTSDSLSGGALGYARAVDLGLLPNLRTWATIGFAGGAVEGKMFSTLTTNLSSQMFFAGGRAQYDLLRFVAVGGRLDAGPSRAGLTLTEGSRTLHDSAWGVAATAAVSVDLRALAFSRFKLALRAELGYTLASKVELAPAEANDASTIQLEMSQASLGHLDVSGKFFSMMVASQF